MKRTAIILAMILGIGMLHSCEEEKEHVLNLDNVIAPSITSPDAGASFTLTEDAEGELLFSFEWTPADYQTEGLPQVRYLLQADVAENNWEDATTIIDIAETLSTSHDITVGTMNTLAISRMDIEPFETGEITFRVLAFLTRANNQTWLYSAPVNVEVTTFEQVIEVDADILNVPGNYQGWAPDNDDTVIYSLDFDDIFEGYMYFDTDDVEFKYAIGSWATNWGDDDADGNLQPDGANIVAGEAGVYKLNVDLNQLTHEFLRTEWSIIGNAGDALGDWDTDIFLEVDTDYFNDTWQTRLSATVQLGEGEFKFRANSDWDINLGVEEGSVLEHNGENIVVEEAGEYTITLDLGGPLYLYSLIKE